MPEYLAPGVYVEEVSYRSKSIEGVSTSTAAFVGPTRFGPVRGEPEMLTCFADFQRIYGGLDPLSFGGQSMHNYVAQAVRTFYAEGGGRCYVARVYRPDGGDGRASATVGDAQSGPTLTLRARYPGAAGNMRVILRLRLGLNVLAQDPLEPANPACPRRNVLRGVREGDTVWVSADGHTGAFHWAEAVMDGQQTSFQLHPEPGSDGEAAPLAVSDLDPSKQVRVVTCNVSALMLDARGNVVQEETYGGLALHPGSDRSLAAAAPASPESRATALYVPLVVECSPATTSGASLARLLFAQRGAGPGALEEVLQQKGVDGISDASLSLQVRLTGGSDGARPTASEVEGDDGAAFGGSKSGLATIADRDDVAIVAAPGSTADYPHFQQQADAITRLLIAHCETLRYRIAVLDAAEDHLVSDVRAYRAQLDSTYAALYYPWLRALDPVSGQVISLPPSGFVAGIYARNDAEIGVHKAPANEEVRTALGMRVPVNQGQQDVLNPEGVDCFRSFEGRGIRLWGARTISSDPEWKYVNLRRYFIYLEHSLDHGTQWAVFMPNGDALWANVTTAVSDFLFTEWKAGHLLGSTPAEAYFVRCDRTTMTQNDLDNGRLICLVGVAPLRPAEFVVFRIGQWTASK